MCPAERSYGRFFLSEDITPFTKNVEHLTWSNYQSAPAVRFLRAGKQHAQDNGPWRDASGPGVFRRSKIRGIWTSAAGQMA
jgi:hypothetical protein